MGVADGSGSSRVPSTGDPQSPFDPATYDADIRTEIPGYDDLQDRLLDATGSGCRRVLDLGTGTGTTLVRVLARHPGATAVGLDADPAMLDAARRALGAAAPRVDLVVQRLEDPLPDGPFDLVVSALAVHHLSAAGKADLFARVARVLAPGGRFVLADLVVPDDPAEATVVLDDDGYDRPDRASDQLAWLRRAGLEDGPSWVGADLAVLVADAGR